VKTKDFSLLIDVTTLDSSLTTCHPLLPKRFQSGFEQPNAAKFESGFQQPNAASLSMPATLGQSPLASGWASNTQVRYPAAYTDLCRSPATYPAAVPSTSAGRHMFFSNGAASVAKSTTRRQMELIVLLRLSSDKHTRAHTTLARSLAPSLARSLPRSLAPSLPLLSSHTHTLSQQP